MGRSSITCPQLLSRMTGSGLCQGPRTAVSSSRTRTPRRCSAYFKATSKISNDTGSRTLLMKPASVDLNPTDSILATVIIAGIYTNI
ncbi:hypothetical protein AZE42_02331 [Rhizopogon vesiculosus]|uniref:Uncharacterized protein n=1 Tax=Rhizopogon vesiculosus TaxID=180088 RepID=A0A1J8RGV3_9AGAM|nr:hypothetical protein AZE42_02331 [Rhizopogon vesiculosus]